VRVFVAGASGALGVPVVRLLIERGHAVTGMTSSERKRGYVESAGARAAVADALDAGAVLRAVSDAAPEAVVSLLTRLPARGPMTPRDLRPNAIVQSKGTANVLAAARAAGVQRVVVQSIVFRYGYGDIPGVVTEETPPRDSGPAFAQFAIDGIRGMEDPVLAAGGIVLRFGAFYGVGAGHMRTMETMLRRRVPMLPGGDRGALPWIHLEDAASATLAAVENGRGGEVYNIVDDEPVSFAAFAREVASVIGAPQPRSVPLWLARAFMRYAALFTTSTLRVSNAKAKRELGWMPRYPTIREGLRAAAGAA
jgi:nucleoside-diphosphate-sugar epimerase